MQKSTNNLQSHTEGDQTIDYGTPNPPTLKWLKKSKATNLEGASSYLSLIYPPVQVAGIVARLKVAEVEEFEAKDVLRASGLRLLGENNSHVKKNLAKIENKQSLSPILLVRDSDNGKVVIADGYHRVCAIYTLDEQAKIHAQITGLEG